MDLLEIKGLGEKTVEKLGKLKIYSVEDLVQYYPYRYESFSSPCSIQEADLSSDNNAIVAVLRKKPTTINRGGKTLIVAQAYDKYGKKLELVWFNLTYLVNSLKVSTMYVFWGKLQPGSSFKMTQAQCFLLSDYNLLLNKLHPVYPLKDGIRNKRIRNLVSEAINTVSFDEISKYDKVARDNGFIAMREAICKIHFPGSELERELARKRIVFDEFYSFFEKLSGLKHRDLSKNNNYVINKGKYSQKLIESLPFELTASQLKVYNEISDDLSSQNVCSRLIQGDVGCGKTIIALLAMLDACEAGFQCAIMAPTEVLALQHFKTICDNLSPLGISVNVELLTGSKKAGEKKTIKKRLSEHKIDIIIGTHALIEDNVEFDKLALVVIDEQHRFGVNQRKKLREKNVDPHVLVISATPIPRTLALMLYGDLQLSMIDEMPSNRAKIKTAVIDESLRMNSYKLIAKQIADNHQAYIICPMIEENDDFDASDVKSLAAKLSQVFSDSVRIGILHGKMKPEMKNEVMRLFSDGEIDILVSTTVIEVGINVPNATVIMIEDAQRFGLAQLHQLRGRVGRGKDQGYCILVNTKVTEESKKRLDVLYRMQNGFDVANEDLNTRGPGDIFGIRQSGEMLFKLGDIYADNEILKLAHDAAERNSL